MAPQLTIKVFISDALKCVGILRLSLSKMEVLKGLLKGKHLVITCTLTVNHQEIPAQWLINCGTNSIAFMDQDFDRHHQTPLQELKYSRQVNVIKRRPIESWDISHVAKVGMIIQDSKEQ
jgi:hypothetical protein